jgi:DNA (cytosine-5)-methyltransferase 1
MVGGEMKIPVIDLFSGAGGLSCGLKNCGLDICAAVEIDKNAIETYKANIGNIVIEKDISKLKGTELLEFAGLKKGQLFILAGCPPCQGFSSVGPRNVDDIRNQLVFDYVRLIEETRPWFILMENVPGMSRGVGKEIFMKVKKELSKKYLIKDEILDSADFGVPQHRKRLVLHGIRRAVVEKYLANDFELEMPIRTHCSSGRKEDTELLAWETVRVIEKLPFIKAGEKHDTVPNHQCRKLEDINIRRIKATPHNGGSRDSWPDELVLDCHRKKVSYKDVYGRMNYNAQAPTITAGCLSYSKGRFGHPVQDRPISAREAATLQSFPDDYKFVGNMDTVGRQIGNAVPPKLAEASGKLFIEIITENGLYEYKKCSDEEF